MSDPISIIIWVLLGFVAGLIAKFLMPGRQGGGIILTTILGILGALLGGFIADKTGLISVDTGSFSPWSVVSAVVGAMIILVIFGTVFRKRV
ncbi:MAG: GlsB/YeaQ/YmgE family stress response membrane protein [Verrucomicrobiales bacterium]|nr:GlsB/YeaQ/YmgE family stress response membrane protein [Verrucomicrobiales bacterium]